MLLILDTSVYIQCVNVLLQAFLNVAMKICHLELSNHIMLLTSKECKICCLLNLVEMSYEN